MSDVPVYVNCRDRVSDLRALVGWLEKAGVQRIVLVDNDSSYEPLLEYYKHTPHEVLRLDGNYGSRSLWRADLVPKELFVFTDPDVLPIEQCPLDAIDLLVECLGWWPTAKAALGMYVEDTPSFQSKPWEAALATPDLRYTDGRVYCRLAGHMSMNAGVSVAVHKTLSDTSFAVYPPRARYALDALRTTFPYVMRHASWYHSDDPSEEERYYLSRAVAGPLGSSWAEGAQ